MSCSHKLSLCKLNSCKECPYEGDEKNCPMIEFKSDRDRIPTFGRMLGIYSSGESSHKRKTGVFRSIQKDLAMVGLTPEDTADKMTRSKFRTLISMLKDKNREGGALRDHTIASHLGAFRSISSKWLGDKYDELGIELPAFSIPAFRIEKVPVQEVSDKQIRKVIIQMEKWLASGKKSDRDAFVFTWFALYCGLRAGDICISKWNILRNTPTGMMVVYTPHKTEKYKKKVSFRIDHMAYCMIEPLIGKEDEYIIPYSEKHIPKSWDIEKSKAKGEYRMFHIYLRKKVNKAIKSCGIGTESAYSKKLHAIRKYFVTEAALKFGRKAAADMAGHSLRSQGESYLGTEYGKVT